MEIPIDEPLEEVSKRIDAAVACKDYASLGGIGNHLSRRKEPRARALLIKVVNLLRRPQQSDHDTKRGPAVPDSVSTQRTISIQRPREALPTSVITSGEFADLFARLGIKKPDGRPLHRYRLDADGRNALREALRSRWTFGLPRHNPDAAALFVLWAAHWFQCEYDGGGLKWKDLRKALRVPFDGLEGRPLTRLGLEAWGRNPVVSDNDDKSSPRRMWLTTLAVEGGFPAALLKDVDKWAGRYLEQVVGSLLSESSLDDEVAYTIAESYGDCVPKAFRQEIFFALAGDLALHVVRLRREVEQDIQAKGVPASAWLDATRPDWRSTLPIAAGTEAADRLVDGLMRAEAIRPTGGGSIGCDRVLVRGRDDWYQAVRLGLDGVATGEFADRLLGCDDRLRAFPSGAFARYVVGELALVEPPAEKGDGWRVRPSKVGASILGTPFTTPITVELRDNGVPRVLTAWPGGEPVRAEVCIFAPEGDVDAEGSTLRLIGNGSGGYRPDTLLILVPAGWKVAPLNPDSTVEELDQQVRDGGRLWKVTGTASLTAPEGEVYRVAGGQTADRRDRLRIVGSWPRGIESEEPEVEFLAELREIRVCEGNIERASRKGELHWRPDGGRGWLPIETRPDMGRFDIAWKDPQSGYVLDRCRVFVIGAEAALDNRMITDAVEYRTTGFSEDRLLAADDDLSVERKDGKLVARFRTRPSRRARFLLDLGEGRPLEVSTHFPLGSGIASWSGALVRGGRGTGARLAISELADCVAFSDGRQQLDAKLLGRGGHALRGGAMTWPFRDELPLRGVASDLAALLLPFADIDVWVDLSFVGSQEHWHIRQFEADIVIRNGRLAGIDGVIGDETLPLCGRSITDLTVEVELGTSTPEDRIGGGPPSLPDNLTGAWLLYLRRGDNVISRPSLILFEIEPDKEIPGLAGAVNIPNREGRYAAITACLDAMADGVPGSERDVSWVVELCMSLRGLPPGSLDPLLLMSRHPAAAARVALNAAQQGKEQREAVLSLEGALPFSWCMVPRDCWQKAGEIERSSLVSRLREFLDDKADGIAEQVIREAAATISTAEPLLSWPLFAAGLLGPEHLPHERRALREAVQDHLRRYADQTPDAAQGESMFRIPAAKGLLPDFGDFHPGHWETLDAPCAAAAVAAGRMMLDDDAVRRIKTALRLDPVYFTEAFNAHLVDLLNRNP